MVYPLLFAATATALSPVASGQLMNVGTNFLKEKTGIEIPDHWRIVDPKRNWFNRPLYELKIKAKIIALKSFFPHDRSTIEHYENLLLQLNQKNSVAMQDSATVAKNGREALFKSLRNGALTLLPLGALSLIPGVGAMPLIAGLTIALPALVSFATGLKGQTDNLLPRALYGLKIKADNPLADPINDPLYALIEQQWYLAGNNTSLLETLQENTIEDIQASIGDLSPAFRNKLEMITNSLSYEQNVGGIPGWVEGKIFKPLINAVV